MHIFLAVLFLLKTLFALDAPGELENPTIVSEQGLPSQALDELLKSTGIAHNGSLDDIVQKTQKFWYQGGKERWELEAKGRFDKEKIFPFLEKLKVLEEVVSPVKSYDYALVHGALLSRVRMRLSFLVKEWNRGVRFSKIIFLTGDRDLHPTFEDRYGLMDANNPYLPFREEWRWEGALPQNEVEMMQLVYEQSQIPEEMRKLPVEWISAPKQEKNGKMIRPGTKETLIEWLKLDPQPGECLAISNQPYVGYQDSIAKTYLPETFIITTVGPAADEKTTVEAHLDNLARWIYQERLRFSNANSANR
jgi:hypothetical protein